MVPLMPKPRVAARVVVAVVLGAVTLVVSPADTLRAGDPATGSIEMPVALDPALEVTLFAREPRIVTPIALDVDARGRVWVIESHTHFRKPEYEGPESDRVLVFSDTGGDGRADDRTTFVSGFTHLMGLRVETERTALLASRREIYRLEDHDGDLSCDDSRLLIRLDTKGDYPHNGLSGFAADDLGFVYFGLGENLGVEYRLIGSDGATLEGGGEGGSVYRIRPDGTGLTRWATGFWNPFHLAVDAFGALFTVDNDPDSRPPCRLIHVVRDGDYGYRFWLGRTGLHPFTAWDGELPGTLPMAAGTGEAPSGIVAYEHAALPERYRGALLVTSWGDHRVEMHRTSAHGSTMRTAVDTVVRGDESFRPVGIAVAPDGSVFFSDWVDKDYHVHRKGRIWKLHARQPAPIDPPPPVAGDAAVDGDGGSAARALSHPVRAARERAVDALLERPDADAIARRLMTASVSEVCRYHALVVLARRGRLDWLAVRSVLAKECSPDLAAAAVRLFGATRELSSSHLAEIASGAHPRAVLEAALALWSVEGLEAELLAKTIERDEGFILSALSGSLARIASGQTVSELLAAPDPRMRLLGVLVAKRRGDTERVLPRLRDPDVAVRRAAVQWAGEERLETCREAIEATLAMRDVTRDLLDASLAALELIDGGNPVERDRRSRDERLLSVCTDRERPLALRRLALRSISPGFDQLTTELLEQFLAESDHLLRLEALRTLRLRDGAAVASTLRALARDRAEIALIRREAIAGLVYHLEESRDDLVALLDDPNADIAAAAARGLRGVGGLSAEARATRGLLLEPTLESRLNDLDRLRTALITRADRGDPLEGELVFFQPGAASCSRCHAVGGRGGDSGPDLSTIGRRPVEHLVDSILFPSRDIAPQFTTWLVMTRSGPRVGILLGTGPDGATLLGDAQGDVVRIAARDVISRSLEEISIMPENLIGGLTFREAVDLVAFLGAAR